MIVVSGFPKSGTHALQRAINLLGLNSIHGHIKHKEKEIQLNIFKNTIVPPAKECKHLFIKRDPRNILISQLRYTQSQPVTPIRLISLFRNFDNNDKSLPNLMNEFTGWLTDSDTYIVKFENLIANSKVIQDLACELGVSYPLDCFFNLIGNTITWSGKLSNYKDVWTQEIQDVWETEGGKELLHGWEYV